MNMANTITGIRILCAIALLFCRPLSPLFYSLYIIAGITDMIDGPVARKTNTVSDFGSRLDTIGDFLLVVACLIKLIPVLEIPVWLSIWIAVIALIKATNTVRGYVTKKALVAVHTTTKGFGGWGYQEPNCVGHRVKEGAEDLIRFTNNEIGKAKGWPANQL